MKPSLLTLTLLAVIAIETTLLLFSNRYDFKVLTFSNDGISQQQIQRCDHWTGEMERMK